MLRLRLADLFAGLSLASDLGFGLAPESAMRSSIVATRLARAHGASEDEVRECFYASLLLHVGCPAFAHETAALFGDELVLTRAASRTNLADPDDFHATLIEGATRHLPPRPRELLTERILRDGPEFGKRFDTASCEVGRSVARRLDLGPGIERALYEVSEWWTATASRKASAKRRSPSQPGSLASPSTRQRCAGSGRARSCA